jgi:hypothetical protein
MFPLHASDTAIEIETNVSARIKRVIFGGGRGDFNCPSSEHLALMAA